MKKFFSEIPSAVKNVIYLSGVVIMLWTYHDKFITEVEASESSRITVIANIEAELRVLHRLARIELDPKELEFLQLDIKVLEKQLDCIRQADTDKVKYC